MINNFRCSRCLTFSLLCIALLFQSGCGGSNVKDTVRGTLGLNREAPDEFKVITRAPLEIPENLTLPPPMPGKQRPQEKPALSAAKEAVFGEEKQTRNTDNSSNIEATLLEKAGANQAQADIRTIVNQETQELAEENTPVAQKLLGISTGEDVKPAARVVDAKAEYERIKNNLEEGKSVLEGETPSVLDY